MKPLNSKIKQALACLEVETCHFKFF